MRPGATMTSTARAATVSSEPIASATSPENATERCASCGAPLAGDQRYCLECGERRLQPSSVLLSGPPAQSPPVAATAPPAQSPPPDAPPRSGAVTLLAGVGVLLLAMGVGVLIGRSGGSSRPAATTPQVISVGTTPAGSSGGATTSEAFTDDWPAATNGYTVQLQSLPQSSTQTSAVEAAKTAAGAKGAKNVGALKSEDFSSLTAGSYIVYSGVFHKKPEATKALATLKKSFPAAMVISVSSAAAAKTGASSAGSSGAATGKGAGNSPSNPAPPKVLEELHKTKGKSYEEKSKNLPNVVGT